MQANRFFISPSLFFLPGARSVSRGFLLIPSFLHSAVRLIAVRAPPGGAGPLNTKDGLEHPFGTMRFYDGASYFLYKGKEK